MVLVIQNVFLLLLTVTLDTAYRNLCEWDTVWESLVHLGLVKLLPCVNTSKATVKNLTVSEYVDSAVTLEAELHTTLVENYVHDVIVTLSIASSHVSPCRDAGTLTDHVSVLESLRFVAYVCVCLSSVEDNLCPTDNCR